MVYRVIEIIHIGCRTFAGLAVKGLLGAFRPVNCRAGMAAASTAAVSARAVRGVAARAAVIRAARLFLFFIMNSSSIA